MAMQKPYNLSIKNAVIDMKLPYALKWLTSGSVSESFSIQIYNNQNNALAFSLPRTYSFAMSYTIPANSIPNGFDYKVLVTAWNASGESATSQLVVFTASSTPVITVPPIGVVGNHSYLFTATYSQSESSQMSHYTINLYTSNRTLLKTSGVKTDNLFEHRFDSMKNGELYYVEFIATSKSGLTANSGLIEFTVTYDNPSMYFELSAETLPEKASVKLNWSVNQVIGKTTVAPNYINGTELDVTGGKVFYDEGFEVIDDFTLKIWFRELKKNVDLINLKGSNGNIRLQYKTSDSSFHLYKEVNGWNYHYSLPTNINGDIREYNIFLCVLQKNGRMDIYFEKKPQTTVSFAGVTFDQLNGVTFNDSFNAKFK